VSIPVGRDEALRSEVEVYGVCRADAQFQEKIKDTEFANGCTGGRNVKGLVPLSLS
jgi:hypothetical protein